MKRFNSIFISAGIFFMATSFILGGSSDTSSIEGKVYKVTLTEAKKGGKGGTPIQDNVTFKGGKFRCKTIGHDMGADAIQVDLDKDSVYKDDDGNELIYVDFQGTMTNKLEETVTVNGTIDGYGIEGYVELSKKGKVKKHYDFNGMLDDKKSKK